MNKFFIYIQERTSLLLLAFLLIIAGSTSFANGDKKPTHGKKTVAAGKDTVKIKPKFAVVFADDEHIESFDDVDDENLGSTFFMTSQYDPNFDYYGIWDTVSANPYHVDFSEKTDTTVLYLQDQLKCDYFHPFNGRVTSEFGPRSRSRYHYGMDIDLETGDSVQCAFEGTVRVSHKSRTFGNVVVVRHKNGLETIYAHLSKLNVKIGDHVEAGDVLGLGGNTGRSRGSHLHFEVRYKGKPIDPQKLISFTDHALVDDCIEISKETFNYPQYTKKYDSKKYRSAANSNGHYYTIRKGDTLGRIAQRNGTTVSKICKANGLKSTSLLKPGRKIRLV
jgi:murein DD-endopeptidase MepM/ murein hydrolase activator NlpD